MNLIPAILRELNNPNGGELQAVYARATSAGGHALLGACFAAAGYWWVGPVIAVVYWLLKESGDLRRGGAILNGLEDTAMVWLGTLYGPVWWPWLMMACMGYVMAAGAWRALK